MMPPPPPPPPPPQQDQEQDEDLEEEEQPEQDEEEEQEEQDEPPEEQPDAVPQEFMFDAEVSLLLWPGLHLAVRRTLTRYTYAVHLRRTTPSSDPLPSSLLSPPHFPLPLGSPLISLIAVSFCHQPETVVSGLLSNCRF